MHSNRLPEFVSKRALNILDLSLLIQLGTIFLSPLRNISFCLQTEKLLLCIGMIRRLTSLLAHSIIQDLGSSRMIASSATQYTTRKQQWLMLKVSLFTRRKLINISSLFLLLMFLMKRIDMTIMDLMLGHMIKTLKIFN